MDEDLLSQIPGMVAEYEVFGSAFDDMYAEANDAFQSLFRDRDWAMLGCQIKAAEQEPSFGGTARVSQWRGLFYAITVERENDV